MRHCEIGGAGGYPRDAAASKQASAASPLTLPPAHLRVRAERERLTRAIGHLLQNALEATPPSGQVTLRGFEESAQAIVEITDTGSGMDDEFVRTRLFQPFDSTKGAGMGIGAYECRETPRALGTAEVESAGKRHRFRLSLPLTIHLLEEMPHERRQTKNSAGGRRPGLQKQLRELATTNW
jgi:signal transduction histidine kinase